MNPYTTPIGHSHGHNAASKFFGTTQLLIPLNTPIPPKFLPHSSHRARVYSKSPHHLDIPGSADGDTEKKIWVWSNGEFYSVSLSTMDTRYPQTNLNARIYFCLRYLFLGAEQNLFCSGNWYASAVWRFMNTLGKLGTKEGHKWGFSEFASSQDTIAENTEKLSRWTRNFSKASFILWDTGLMHWRCFYEATSAQKRSSKCCKISSFPKNTDSVESDASPLTCFFNKAVACQKKS